MSDLVRLRVGQKSWKFADVLNGWSPAKNTPTASKNFNPNFLLENKKMVFKNVVKIYKPRLIMACVRYVKFQSWTDFNPASCLILSGYALVKNLAFCRLLTAQTYFFNIFFNNFSTYSKVCTYYFSIPYLRLKKISA